MNGRRRERGFTLIELLVTITIIAILASVGMPMYGSFTQESNVSSLTSELISTMNDARSRAVTERTTIRVRQVTGGWATGWQVVRINNPAITTDDVILFTVNRANSGVATISEAAASTQMDFDRSGRTAARTFTVGVAGSPSKSPKRTLGVNVLGRVSVTKSVAP